MYGLARLASLVDLDTGDEAIVLSKGTAPAKTTKAQYTAAEFHVKSISNKQ